MSKKTLLLIGATGGIGQAVLKEVVNEWNVIATSTQLEKLEAITKSTNVHKIAFDHTSGQETEFLQTISQFGKLDSIVITSGITSDGLAIRLTDELWDKTLQVNLSSIFKILKRAYRIMNPDSSIVVTSSVIARMGNIGQVAYSASKGGLEAMVRTLAKEFASKCTVNAVAPGFIETGMTENLPKEEIIKNIPLGRIGKPEEVASVIKFLIGPGARYITGHTLEVNGGMWTI